MRTHSHRNEAAYLILFLIRGTRGRCSNIKAPSQCAISSLQPPHISSDQLLIPAETSLSLQGRNFPKSRCDPVICAARYKERGSDRTFNSNFGALILQRNHIRGVMRRNVSPGADSWWPISNDLSLRPHFNIFTLRFLHSLFLEIESVTPSVCGDYWLDVGWYYSLSRNSSCHFSGLDCRSYLTAVCAGFCSCTEKNKKLSSIKSVASRMFGPELSTKTCKQSD